MLFVAPTQNLVTAIKWIQGTFYTFTLCVPHTDIKWSDNTHSAATCLEFNHTGSAPLLEYFNIVSKTLQLIVKLKYIRDVSFYLTLPITNKIVTACVFQTQ